MANSQAIEEIISEAAFKQLDQLENKLATNKRAFVDAAKSAKEFTDSIGGAKNLKDFSALVDTASKGFTKLSDSQDKIRLAEIQLETARRKAFDDFERKLNKQIESDVKLRNSRIKSIDKAVKDEARLEAAQNKAATKQIADQEKQLKSDTLLRNARIKNIDEYNKRLAAQNAAINKAQQPYNGLNIELGVLKQRARDIGVQFGTSSKQFREAAASVNFLDTKLKDVDNRLGDNGRSVGKYGNALNGLKSQFSGIAASYLSVYAVIGGFSKIISNNKEIEDSLSDVRRTAGLTANETSNLATQLKKIDTRTSLKGLIDISTIGGQLGIAKDQLAGFTRAIDQLAVTLSGEIPGGAEAVATALGKINGVFKVQQREGTNTEESLNKTGSAILALGQAGLATGEYLQDFTLRTAGTAQVAKISLPTILAYSAVLEETGSSAEVAGTAFNKLVGALSSKREQFFKIAQLADAKLTLKDFTDLINTDANAALQKFFAGLNKGGSNLTTFTDLLDTLKIKSGPAKNAIVALAQNQELLNDRVGQSKKAYADGTLAVDQFKIKNDNLAASLDKVGNELVKVSTGDGFAKFIKQAADATVILIRELDKLAASKSLSELGARLFTFGGGSTYDKVNSLKDRYASAQGALAGSETTTKNGSAKSKDQLLSDFRATRTAALTALTAYNEFKNAVSAGKLTDPKGELQQYKRLSDTLNQRAVALKAAYATAKSVVKVPVDISSALGGDKKETDKQKESKEAKRIRLLAASYEAEEALTIANAKAAYDSSKKELSDTILFETKKSAAVSKSVDQKQKLYKKDSANYKTLEAERVNANTKSSESIEKAIKEGLEKEDAARVIAAKRRLDAIATNENNELTALEKSYGKGELSQEDYEKKRLEIARKYTQLSVAEEIASVEKLIEIQKARGLDVSEQERKISELKLRLSKETTDKQISDNQRFQDEIDATFEKEKEVQAKRRDLIQEVAQLGVEIVNGVFDNQKNKLEEESTAIDEKKARDIENVNESLATEEEKADRIAIIEAQADARKTQIENKQKELEIRKAKFEKAASIVSIGVSTAEAVAKISLQAGILAANPLTLALAPIALAQIPYVIGIGAAQIAAILATPIPKFEHGGVMRKNGLAIYGEVGTELMIDPSGNASLTPDKPTIGHVKAGTQFISHKDLLNMISMPDLDINQIPQNVDFSPVTREIMRSNDKVVKAINKNKTVVNGASKRGFLRDSERVRANERWLNRNS